MNVAIVYDSRTGTTAAAAQAMANAFSAKGHSCTVRPVVGAVPHEVAKADLICIGSWTQGLLVFRQHATRETMSFVERLGDLGGKKAVVFCTYKVATGQMLPVMAKALTRRGAQVLGHFKFRGRNPGKDFSSFVETLRS